MSSAQFQGLRLRIETVIDFARAITRSRTSPSRAGAASRWYGREAPLSDVGIDIGPFGLLLFAFLSGWPGILFGGSNTLLVSDATLALQIRWVFYPR
jgi:hypothetical protein